MRYTHGQPRAFSGLSHGLKAVLEMPEEMPARMNVVRDSDLFKKLGEKDESGTGDRRTDV